MRTALTLLFLSLALTPLAHAGGGHDHHHGHDHGHGEHEEEAPTGPHGGRMLSDGEFGLEVTIFERGAPPQFRLYLFHHDNLLSPNEATATVKLTRFGARIDTFAFSPQADFLTSPTVVDEPHSFLVEVSATHAGEKHRWEYESFEGRTELSDAALKVAELGIEVAAPQPILNSTRVYGRILANEDRVAHLTPRFPGIVKEIRKILGDRVVKNEVLAIIESNQNLQPYELRSQIEGVVVKRHATLGELVSAEREIFVVVDLSEVWADFQVYRDDFDTIHPGQEISVELGGARDIVKARVTYVSPLTDEATQSKLIRAVLPNPSGDLRPGLFASGLLTASEDPVPVAVKREAIQSFRNWQVVYLTDGHLFQAVPVELGRRDATFVEVLSGVNPGDRYVSRNSFIIKADIEKAGASHDH